MSLYSLLRPLLFTLDAERAHGMTVAALKRLPLKGPGTADPRLAIRVAGLDLPNPIGLAPGFDKNAEVPDAMLALGFGFVEVGTLTPRPQVGNPRPRLFRLVEDRAVINRMGFNNDGMAIGLERLRARWGRPGVVGVNIGANKDSPDRIADYVTCVQGMGPVTDYITVNISSPNTPGLRALQDKGALDGLLAAVMDARGDGRRPVFLKVAPDLEPADIDDIADVSMARGIDALIVTNTTISRPPLQSPLKGESGGLSGQPLHQMALARLRAFRSATGGAMPLIGVGGIASAEHAYERIRAGASLIQLYSALVYEGPWLARRIARGLSALLARDGFANVRDAIGTE
ncbi:quinone-dependent dihydroorotate dehydrogenase [Flavisphingomonas formosensis]|uniref:quinone-dependent dihydroorotate dehydrogenase n=1 Tax=Flavisphingomonas formosensis TaxID=861534 RepID=UPI0012F9227E|nr:quinone-dependent dihydroorotate dehydrogenase [Sphingomonas formosensis]